MPAERTIDTDPHATDSTSTDAPATGHTSGGRYPLAVLRIMLGFVLTWAFVDKLVGLGGPTPSERSALSGASPTQGYLSNVDGTFADVFTAMAGNPIVDVLFLIGLGAGGVALLLGIAGRLAAVATVAVMGPLYLSSLPLSQNPIVDVHLVYCVLAIALAQTHAGDTLGLGRAWARRPLVRAYPAVLG